MVDFSHLLDTQFEEFCYDLLVSKNFTNINWRKGTGKQTSPADNGRDIEADLVRINFDKSTQIEKYFFECKHYQNGVPPTAISNALTWAESERPDYLIIITSNFLSNPCKEYISKYINENKPKFQIRTWENKLLEMFLAEDTNLYMKWNLNVGDTNYHYINKYHLMYVTKSKQNTLDYLFNILDNYDVNILNEILKLSYRDISIRMKINFMETIKTYDKFKEIILTNRSEYHNPYFIHQMIAETLAWAYHFGDIADKQNMINRVTDLKNNVERQSSDNDTIAYLTKHIEEMDDNYKKYNKWYNDFCENIVSKLLEEPTILDKIKSGEY